MSFVNKVVIITGASSGIGAATAVKFAEGKAKVVITGRNANKLEKTSQLCENHGVKPFVIIGDITKDETVEKIIKDTIAIYGKIDVLVNNAGALGPCSIEEPSAATILDTFLAINFRAAVNLTNMAVSHLVKTKGNIVNVSSIGSTMAVKESWAYCASKAALDQFSKCIALDLAPKGVRVNVVSPGIVKTDFVEYLSPKSDVVKVFDTLAQCTALGRVSDAEEVADMVIYLAGDKAKGVTGSSFVVDNGALLTHGLSGYKKLL